MKSYLSALALLVAAPAACIMPGMAEPSPVCDFETLDTSAWINMMPGPGGPPGNLVVMVKVEDDGISRRFDSRGLSADGTLMLDVVECGPKEGLGKIVYRGKGLRPQRVDIYCGGALVTRIEDVTIAQ
ncbi:MAG: hypothetical protein WA989_05000 [Henriciella sp.]|uniref:hypothetical protein n=1 Tax=Henriciella sp. TaxID=1968823 RepID=UPI003C768EE9